MRERVSVYLRGLVESPVVDAELRRSILFLYQDGWTTPRAVAFLDDADGQHVLDQLPFLLSAHGGVTPDSLLDGGLVARVDLVLDDVAQVRPGVLFPSLCGPGGTRRLRTAAP